MSVEEYYAQKNYFAEQWDIKYVFSKYIFLFISGKEIHVQKYPQSTSAVLGKSQHHSCSQDIPSQIFKTPNIVWLFLQYYNSDFNRNAWKQQYSSTWHPLKEMLPAVAIQHISMKYIETWGKTRRESNKQLTKIVDFWLNRVLLCKIINNWTIVSVAFLISFYFAKEACLTCCLSLSIFHRDFLTILCFRKDEGSDASPCGALCKTHHFLST